MFRTIFGFLLSGLTLFANQGQIVKANGIDIWYEDLCTEGLLRGEPSPVPFEKNGVS